MKKTVLLFFLLLSSGLASAHAPFWGKTGHRATAEIAEKYLSPQTRQAVKELLDGDGMALVSTYADDIKSDKKFAKYSTWHYVNIPEGKTYADLVHSGEMNIITAIEKTKTGLKDTTLPKEQRKFYLKMLIHLIGDLHQPMHVGRPEDKGGNEIPVFWFNERSNLHRVWDEDLLYYYEMSYTELAANTSKLSEEELAEIRRGSVTDWLNESHAIADKIYETVKDNEHLEYAYAYHWLPVVREQLQKGGIRLAKELNEIFD